MKIQVIDRNGQPHALDWDTGQSLMELLRDADFVLASCGGNCLCGTCHVYLNAAVYSQLPPPGSDEWERLEELNNFRVESSRLSCQISLTQDLKDTTLALAPYE
jgi:2Fe-2S ferredoxin